MTETTEGERAGALGEPHIHDLDFLTRLIHDADRLRVAEELLQEARTYVADATAGTVDMDWQSPRERVTASIDAFLEERHD